MSTQDLPLLKALTQRMDYLAQRQALIMGNIANADTPKYTPRDVEPFANFMDTSRGVSLAVTDSGHISVQGQKGSFKEKNWGDTWEVAPNGNAVVLEEQMVAASETLQDYSLATSLYQKQMGLLRTALGRG